MRLGLIAAGLSAATLSGCAMMQGMGHGGMSHDEMMSHCQMMEQHQAQGGQGPAEYDPAQHGGMSYEEMMRQCAAMHDQHGATEPPAPHPQ